MHPSAHRGEIVMVPAPKIKQLTVVAFEDSKDCRGGSRLSRALRADLPISMLLRWHSHQYEQGSRCRVEVVKATLILSLLPARKVL